MQCIMGVYEDTDDMCKIGTICCTKCVRTVKSSKLMMDGIAIIERKIIKF